MENFWKNKRVFVTGGNGFLGSYLVSLLIEKGCHPVVLKYEENPGGIFEQRNLAKKCTVVNGDIRDYALIESILKKHKIQIIFHLAAQAIVDQAIDDPLATLEVNIQGTWNILEASRKNGTIEKIIIASSDKAYGEHTNLPYREHTHDLRGAYPYEVSKACADLISQSYAKTFKLPVTVTRFVNFYGPGDNKLSRIVPRTIYNLYRNKAPVIRNTGRSRRDYLYVEDAADAYRVLAEKMENPAIHGEVFDFGVNKPYSVIETIALISKEMGKEIPPIVVNTHGFEIQHQFSTFEKAESVLGWRPQHTFAEGIRKTIPWYIDYFERGGGVEYEGI